jgi:peroxiredoxin
MEMAEVSSTRTLSLGTKAPALILPDAEGNNITLEEARGPKGLVVAFVCNHCPFVIHLADRIGLVADTCIAKGVGFVAINANDVSRYPADSPEKMADTARKFGWTFPYLYDESQAVAKSFFAACTPDFFVFDAELKLTYSGQFDQSRPGNKIPVTGEALSLAVNAMIRGDSPLSDQKPSSGCSIKWKIGNEPSYFAV